MWTRPGDPVCDVAVEFASDSKMTMQFERDLAPRTGRLVQDRPITSPAEGQEMITVTSGFGPRWGRMHEGLDIAAGFGAPIRAAAGGTVSYAGWLGGLMRAKTPVQRAGAMLAFRPAMLTPRIALAEGLTDLVCGLNMGQTAEVLSREFRITRERQDEYALQSHQRAVAARERLREEIVPVFPPPSHTMVRDDVGPRENQTLEALAKLKPYFDRRNGTVTVGTTFGATAAHRPARSSHCRA